MVGEGRCRHRWRRWLAGCDVVRSESASTVKNVEVAGARRGGSWDGGLGTNQGRRDFAGVSRVLSYFSKILSALDFGVKFTVLISRVLVESIYCHRNC